MLYNDYIKTLSEKFDRRLEGISADYNFNFGDEFEIAICEILRDFLPTKYGICRGFVVDRNGNKAGDDIIIYDQERFPTLRINKRNDYSRKENIPIEAVYGYIEAKHKLTPSTLKKAIEQVKEVKKICSTRAKMGIDQFDPYININVKYEPYSDGYPNYRNPVFTAIISRYIEDENNNTDYNSVKNFFIRSTKDLTLNKFPELPEMIVAGKDLCAFSCYKNGVSFKLTKFLLESKDYGITAFPVKGLSYGFAIANIAHSLDWIRLGKMPWTDLLNEIVQISKATIADEKKSNKA